MSRAEFRCGHPRLCRRRVNDDLFGFPPLFFGVAAFTPDRAADVTAIMHELGLLTLITTESVLHLFFVGGDCGDMPDAELGGAFAVSTLVRLLQRMDGVWCLDGPAIAFLTRTGRLPGMDLLAFWSPALLLGVWLVMISVLLIKAIMRRSATRYRRLPAEISAAALVNRRGCKFVSGGFQTHEVE